MSTDTDKTYNGWTNYETWSVALLLDNDEGSSAMRQEMAQQAWDDAKAGDAYPSQTRLQAATYALQEALKEYHEKNNPLANDNSVYAQLLSGALSEVNWRELASNYLDEIDTDENGDSEDEDAE